MIELGLCRLFFEAGLAVSLAFILGVAVGLAITGYLRKRKEDI